MSGGGTHLALMAGVWKQTRLALPLPGIVTVDTGLNLRCSFLSLGVGSENTYLVTLLCTLKEKRMYIAKQSDWQAVVSINGDSLKAKCQLGPRCLSKI